jgi:hypothetical protein
MRKVALLFMGALMLAPGAFAWAGQPQPVCRVSEVLDVISLELHKREIYIRIDPDLVWQQPTADRTVVRCGVCALVATYDMPSFGERPLRTCEQHAFDVRALPNGFIVQFLR